MGPKEGPRPANEERARPSSDWPAQGCRYWPASRGTLILPVLCVDCVLCGGLSVSRYFTSRVVNGLGGSGLQIINIMCALRDNDRRTSSVVSCFSVDTFVWVNGLCFLKNLVKRKLDILYCCIGFRIINIDF